MLRPLFGVGDRVLDRIQVCTFESESAALAFFAAGVAEDAKKYVGLDDVELLYVGEFDTVAKRVIRKPFRVIAKASDLLKPKH